MEGHEERTPAQKEKDYADIKATSEEVIKHFAERTDMKIVEEAGKATAELKSLCDARHREIVQCVRELQGQVKREQQQHQERKDSLLNPAPREEMLKERNRVEEDITRLRKETDALREENNRSETRGSELGEREQSLWQQENVEVPRLRHAISLYANISSIRWDYSSRHVKGFITSASGSGIKSFELEPSQQSEFAVINSLWDLMEA